MFTVHTVWCRHAYTEWYYYVNVDI